MIEVTDERWFQHSTILTLRGENLKLREVQAKLINHNVDLMKRAEEAEAEALTLRNAGVDLLTRAEAAEKERDMLKAALERRGEAIFGREGD